MHRHSRNSLIILAFCALLPLSLAVSLSAGTLHIPRWTVDGGGVCSQGSGSLDVCSTLSQPDASGALLLGGSFALNSGFWPGSQAIQYKIYLPITRL